MSGVAKFFLRAKHWQIFILVFGVYLVGQIVVMDSIVARPQSEEILAKGGLPIGLLLALSTLGFFAWFWSMGSFFSAIAKPELRLKSGFFRTALIYPLFYFVLFIATFPSFRPGLVALILPLHLFAMFCIFYVLYFVSKSLVLAESNKPASFYDYAGPFFLLWFFPIGIWIIQPRVNRLYAERMNAESSPIA
jgi:hypothetical protein